jgi:hypothetical protein
MISKKCQLLSGRCTVRSTDGRNAKLALVKEAKDIIQQVGVQPDPTIDGK